MTSVVAPQEEQQLHQDEPQRDLATFNAVSTELSAAFPNATTTAAESDSPQKQKGLLLDPQQLRATNDERHSKEGNGASHSQEEEEEKNREEEDVDESQFLMEKSGFPSMAARSFASAGSTASPKNRNGTDAPPTESDVGAQMLLQEDGETTAAAADASCSSPLSASSKRLRYVRCLVYVEDAEDEAMRGVNNCEAHMKEAEPQDEEEDDATEGPIMTAADDVAPSDHDDDDGKHTTTTLEEEEHPKATEDGEKKPKKQKSVRMDPSIDHPKDRKEGDEEPQQPQPHDEGPHTGDVGGDGGDSTPAAAGNGPMLLSHSNVGEPKRSKRVPTKTSIPAAAAVVGRMGHYGTAPFRATAQRFHSHRTATSDVPFVALPSTTATTNNSIPHGKGFSTFGSAKDRFYVPPSATVHAMTMLTHAAPTSRSRSASSSAAATGARRGSRSGSREPAAVNPEGGATTTTATAAPAAGRSRSPNAALPHRAPQSRGSSADRFYRAPPATCNAPLYVPKGMGDVQRVGRNGPLTQTAPRFMTAGRSASSASSSSPAGGGVAGEDHPHHHPGSSDEVGGTPQYLSMTTRDREEKHLSTYRGVGAGAAVAAFRSTQPRFRDPVVNNQAPFRVGPSFVDEILRR